VPETGQIHRFEESPWEVRRSWGSDTDIFGVRYDPLAAESNIRFVDLVKMPPESYIGMHTHAADSEEIYVVVRGEGVMRLDGKEEPVGPGDVIRNAAGGTHGLRCGATELWLVVVEVVR
jgi:mannose-6-phosphate isomerase-like protein (cupin superfamily)